MERDDRARGVRDVWFHVLVVVKGEVVTSRQEQRIDEDADSLPHVKWIGRSAHGPRVVVERARSGVHAADRNRHGPYSLAVRRRAEHHCTSAQRDDVSERRFAVHGDPLNGGTVGVPNPTQGVERTRIGSRGQRGWGSASTARRRHNPGDRGRERQPAGVGARGDELSSSQWMRLQASSGTSKYCSAHSRMKRTRSGVTR